MTLEILEEGQTIEDVANMPVTEDLISPHLEFVEWSPRDRAARVHCTDGSYHDFQGISREKLETLIYAPHPAEILQEWLTP